jgi:hypothetical protein
VAAAVPGRVEMAGALAEDLLLGPTDHGHGGCRHPRYPSESSSSRCRNSHTAGGGAGTDRDENNSRSEAPR